MVSIAIHTLGCKVNQLESESIAEAFKRAGFRVIPWEIDGQSPHILIINTCTVTSKAEQKARRIIRGALKLHPGALVIVTGCYAQMDPQGIGALETGLTNRLFVISGDKKSALLDLPGFLKSRLLAGESAEEPDFSQTLSELLSSGLLSSGLQAESVPIGQERFRFNPESFSFHSRAFLKIQDGCNNSCSYCRVSLARGPSVSLDAPEVLTALKTLEARGYGEAVLTGVNISQYHDGYRDLSGLLEYLLRETGSIKLRLSSLEPDGISQALVTVLSNPRVQPHFHLSIQSGSPLILERMGRSYTPEQIEKGVQVLRSIKEDPFLACDIITGFPGETPEAFEATYRLCRRLDFAWIHGFPYSRRPGTRAYTFKESVTEREAHIRVDRLLVLGNEGRQRYIRRWLGRTVEGIVEAQEELSVVSDNYLKLRLILPGEVSPKPGSVLRCRILDLPDSEVSRFDATAKPDYLQKP